MRRQGGQVASSGSHGGLMRPPVGLRNRWLSKEGTKGGGCYCCCRFRWFLWCLWLLSSLDGGVLRRRRLAEAVDNDCVRAHDAHEFSIDLWSQPMPLLRLPKVRAQRAQRAHRRNFLVHVRKQSITNLVYQIIIYSVPSTRHKRL